MLVLSRRTNQQIVFPNLDIKLQVLQVKGKVVKLGIQAPEDVPILRQEVCDKSEKPTFQKNVDAGIDRHQLRNHLNTINLGLMLFKKQTEIGRADEAEVTMERVVNELQKLDTEVGDAKQKVKKISQTRPMRLLVVEDDDNERELLAGLLRLHGFEVSVARSGIEALDYLGTHETPDLVLMDMKMPELDGPSTIKEIRSNDRLAGLKIFAVSGTAPQSMGLESEAYSGWFPKPLDPARLIEAMAESVDNHSTSV